MAAPVFLVYMILRTDAGRLDSFSAAILGLPKLLRDDDIHAEYPADTDDEYVTEKGFQPTLPGEYTKLSSALALFRVARILGKVLERVYPAASSHELSLQQLSALEAELDDWSDALSQHLKLNFKQDKPFDRRNREPFPAAGMFPTVLLCCQQIILQDRTDPRTGPCILLHQDLDPASCCRLDPGAQVGPCPHRHWRGQQAHCADHPAARRAEHVLLLLPE